jgi:hypothetical protein
MDGSVSHVEKSDDLRDPFREAWKKGKGWLVDEPKGRFIERYLSGDMAIVLRLREPASGGETIQDGLVIYHLPETLKPSAIKPQREIGDLRFGGKQPFVFTPDIELMEGVKKRVSSFVRHESFDSGLFVLRKPRFVFNTLGAEEIVRGAENWKVRFVAGFFAIPCGECGGDQIEAASKGVDDRSGRRIDLAIKRFLRVCSQELKGRVSIRLYHEHIRAVPLPGSDALLERWDLGYGPVNGSLSV